MKKIVILLALMLAVVSACNKKATPKETSPEAIDTVLVKNESPAIPVGDKPKIVDFYATWCGPCKMLTPILEEMEKKYGDRIEFVRIDIDEQPDLANAYGIEAVPTLMFMKTDGSQEMQVGLLEPAQLEAMITDLLK